MQPIQLINALAEAASAAHTSVSIAKQVAEAVAQIAPLETLTLGRTHTHHRDRANTITWRQHDQGAVVKEREAAALDPRLRNAIEERRSLCTERTLVLVSAPDDGPLDFAILEFADTVPNELDDPAVLAAASHVLHGAMRNATLIERVATLSRKAHRENQQLRQQLVALETPDRLIAQSVAMRAVLDQVGLVAHHPTTVLVRGESGTGKEVLARRIHRLSPRSPRPFIKVNCGAIPIDLVESELFGHVRGAFTGASGHHRGLFERADGGTILLDEIGELSLPAQVKLLRVLQEGTIERVGGEQTLTVDVRVVAATHRNLEVMVAEGAFRQDLYYRLNVFPIEIPPLRERPEDVPALVEVLLAEICERLGRSRRPHLRAADLARLRSYPWPGNVRELENQLERAVILSRGDHLELVSLELVGRSPNLGSGGDPVLTFAEASRVAIRRALDECAGRIYGKGGAAELLGLKPSTLQSKMKRLGMARRSFSG